MTGVPRLCLIEDDPIMGESLCDRFELEGFSVQWLQSVAEARPALQRGGCDAVISDIRLADGQGDALFQEMMEAGSVTCPWLFITGYGAVDRAVALLKLGATDYITKPFDLDALVEKLRGLIVQGGETGGAQTARLGVSPAMRRVESLLPRLATQAGTVLLTGESGVGKEAVARELHRLDPATADQPFVAVNCGGLTETLLEAELFGHEKGAFTGAVRSRAGVFEQAHGGTLLLDEVGDMPMVMQIKLLRAIQDRQVVRVGGDRPIPVNLRLICATHRDLLQMVREGSFREDLYYRIHVIHVRIPPLRERREDILWLAGRFLDEYARARNEPRKQLTAAAEQALLRHPWPGNIRELRHAIERACILSTGPLIQAETVFDEPGTEPGTEPDERGRLTHYLKACEADYIRRALDLHDGHIGHTAANLGISRKNLWERMKRLGMSD
ncbi:transcriptional regulator [Thioalkalivibrio denitrificans]|uniref:Transcriptional regulator n=1 Tax=Thioalkalivibrio denitrificans TaxID=108003 RepID=A0A1V3NFU2_9GAMM|nr:sigma-54 dependent transcriptional regulator [Thioalkalivibrio denitrificans]OOG23864.1 transcriptional regulator [Thioalkalivibrio denitrificans]